MFIFSFGLFTGLLYVYILVTKISVEWITLLKYIKQKLLLRLYKSTFICCEKRLQTQELMKLCRPHRLTQTEAVSEAACSQREYGPGGSRRPSYRPHPVHRSHQGRYLLPHPAQSTSPIPPFNTPTLPRQVSLIASLMHSL